jgi:hypothetical protein
VVGDEGDQLFHRLEVRGVAGLQVLDAAGHLPPCRIRIEAQVHDEEASPTSLMIEKGTVSRSACHVRPSSRASDRGSVISVGAAGSSSMSGG